MDDALQLGGLVELHVRGEAEAVAQRRRQQSRARGGADQGERGQFERDGGGAGALADDHVDAEVLHRHVQHLLGGPGHAVDLVEEEDLALLEGGEDRGQVAGVLDGGARGDADGGAHLGRDDHREGGLAQARGAGEQDVVGGGPTRACRPQDEVELLADLLLTDELVQVLGAQGGLDGLVLTVGGRADEPLGGGVVGRVVPVHCLPRGRGSDRRACTRRGDGVGGAPLPRLCWSAGPVEGLEGGLQQLAHLGRAFGGLGLGSHGGHRLVGLAGGVPEADQGGMQLVAPAWVTGAPMAGAPIGSPRRSFSSSSNFWAPLLPMPGTAISAFSSPVATARRSASGRARRASPGRGAGRRRSRSGAARRPGVRRRP